jgi:regulator of sigma D
MSDESSISIDATAIKLEKDNKKLMEKIIELNDTIKNQLQESREQLQNLGKQLEEKFKLEQQLKEEWASYWRVEQRSLKNKMEK